MKNLSIAPIFLILLSSCNSSLNDEMSSGKKIDPQVIEKISGDLCSSTQKLKVSTRSVELDYGVFSNKTIFGFEKGSQKCAIKGDFHQDTLFDYLGVYPSSGCIENGSLWIYDSMSMYDGGKIFNLEIRRYDGNQAEKVLIQTKRGRDFDSIKSAVGIIVFECADSEH